MKIKYLVTNRAEAVSALQDKSYQIIMLNGTVPNWEPRAIDLHYDHHSGGFEPIQIHEMPCPLPLMDKVCFVTTGLCVESCVAAAYAQIDPIRDIWFTPEIYLKLSAISFEDQQLKFPDRLSEYSDFARQCVMIMKQEMFNLVDNLTRFNPDHNTAKDKELIVSIAFEEGTQDLLKACTGLKKFPSEKLETKLHFN